MMAQSRWLTRLSRIDGRECQGERDDDPYYCAYFAATFKHRSDSTCAKLVSFAIPKSRHGSIKSELHITLLSL
jgi:hypothetical protein